MDKILFAETPNIFQPMTASVTKLVGTFIFCIYCKARQQIVLKASYSRHGRPASHYGHLRESSDLGVAANSHLDIVISKNEGSFGFKH